MNLMRNDSMKKSYGLCLVVGFLVLSRPCFAQSAGSPYEIATWQDFHSAAISYTFDDNCPNQLKRAVPIFDTFGYKLTLFTISNVWPYWKGLKFAASEGHEIASHSVSHPYLDSVSDERQLSELKLSQDAIIAHVPGQRCLTFAYPYCHVGNVSIVRQYYIAARGGRPRIEDKTPLDFMNICSIMCGSKGNIRTTADFDSAAEKAVRSNGWLVYMLHALDEEPAASPLSSDTLRASLEYLKARESKFWVATFGDVVKYIKERNAASVSEVSIGQDSIVIRVTDALDDSIYNCPITVRRPLPSGWTTSVVIQNGKEIESQIVEVNAVRYIMFNVIPYDGDNVLLKKGAISGVEQMVESSPRPSFMLCQNYPNPFNPTTVIKYQVPTSSQVNLRVYDMLGREVAILVDEKKSAGSYNVSFHADKLPSGMYFYTLQTGEHSSTKKLVLLK